MNTIHRGNHTISQLQVYSVWVTKYRYHVLKGEIQKRCRERIIQICDVEVIIILKGVVSKDHVPMHSECPPSTSISDIVTHPIQNENFDISSSSMTILSRL